MWDLDTMFAINKRAAQETKSGKTDLPPIGFRIIPVPPPRRARLRSKKFKKDC